MTRLLAGAFVVTTLIACGGNSLPSDVNRLGLVRLATDAESTGVITDAAALRAATDAGYDYPNRTAYLVVIVPVGPGSGAAAEERLVWLIRSQGIEIRPPADPGSPAPEPAHFAYVLVDARSGEVVGVTYGV